MMEHKPKVDVVEEASTTQTLPQEIRTEGSQPTSTLQGGRTSPSNFTFCRVLRQG